MVNLWSPDPPQNHCDAEVGPVISSSLTVLGGSSSDSESEEIANNGYELLPMTPPEDVDFDSDEGEVNNTDQQTHLPASDADDFNSHNLEVVNHGEVVYSPCDSERTAQQRQEMDPELMEQVKVAMSGFSLPLTAVPNWAFLVPEEEWRSHLVERMQCIQQRGAKPRQSNHERANDDTLTSQNGK